MSFLQTLRMWKENINFLIRKWSGRHENAAPIKNVENAICTLLTFCPLAFQSRIFNDRKYISVGLMFYFALISD